MTSYIRLERGDFRIAINFNRLWAFRNWNDTKFYFEIYRTADNRRHIELFLFGKKILFTGYLNERK